MGRVQKRLEEGLGGTLSNRSSKASEGYKELGSGRDGLKEKRLCLRTESPSGKKGAVEGCVMGGYPRCPFQLMDPLAKILLVTCCDPKAE